MWERRWECGWGIDGSSEGRGGLTAIWRERDRMMIQGFFVRREEKLLFVRERRGMMEQWGVQWEMEW